MTEDLSILLKLGSFLVLGITSIIIFFILSKAKALQLTTLSPQMREVAAGQDFRYELSPISDSVKRPSSLFTIAGRLPEP